MLSRLPLCVFVSMKESSNAEGQKMRASACCFVLMQVSN